MRSCIAKLVSRVGGDGGGLRSRRRLVGIFLASLDR